MEFTLTVFSYAEADCYCMIGNEIIQIHNFLTLLNGEILVVAKAFTSYKSLYTYPFESCYMKIFLIDRLMSNLFYWNSLDIKCKCFVYPLKESFVSFQLLHTLT